MGWRGSPCGAKLIVKENNSESRPPVLLHGISPHPPRRGGSPDPPAGFGTGFIPRGGFRPLGEFLSQRWERNQRIAGGDSHRRRKQVPSGSSSFSPSPPFTGDTPIPFRKISGAQNMVPGMISPGPLGPGAVQNFGLCHFTAAPGSDQPWQPLPDGLAGVTSLGGERAGLLTRPPVLLRRDLEAEPSGAPVWSSAAGRVRENRILRRIRPPAPAGQR